MFGTGEEFTYVECGTCGSLQIESVPADLATYYPAGYYSMRPRQGHELREGLRFRLAAQYAIEQTRDADSWRARAFRSLLPVPTEWDQYGRYLADSHLRSLDDPILDVGCGSSPHRLAALLRLGFRNVLGIDPFVPADLRFQGVPVRKQGIHECDGLFAWIMFHHSLEHVPDPVGALKDAAARLTPGGRCLVRIPIVGGLMWRHYGVEWVEFDAPRHLHLFSSEGLDAAARRAGLVVEKCTHESEGWELAWSEAYRRGIAMQGPLSRELEAMFDEAQLAAFNERAALLNRLHVAGRAAFVLKKA